MRFRVGDIVKISKKSEFYGAFKHTPKDMEGKINYIYNDSPYRIAIIWDNDEACNLDENDLGLVRRMNE